MKGQVKAGAPKSNKFRLTFVDPNGIPSPPIYITRIGEESREVVLADMPDFTRQSTGQVKAIDTEIDVVGNDDVAIAYLEGRLLATESGAVGHKTAALVALLDEGENVRRTHEWSGVIVKGRKRPELSVGPSDGTAVVYTYMLSLDDSVLL